MKFKNVTILLVFFIILHSSRAQTCGSNCERCSIDNSRCENCNRGYFLKAGVCNECPEKCESCSTIQLCLKCKDGSAPSKGECKESQAIGVYVVIGFAVLCIIYTLGIGIYVLTTKKKKDQKSNSNDRNQSEVSIISAGGGNIGEYEYRGDVESYWEERKQRSQKIHLTRPLVIPSNRYIIKKVVYGSGRKRKAMRSRPGAVHRSRKQTYKVGLNKKYIKQFKKFEDWSTKRNNILQQAFNERENQKKEHNHTTNKRYCYIPKKPNQRTNQIASISTQEKQKEVKKFKPNYYEEREFKEFKKNFNEFTNRNQLRYNHKPTEEMFKAKLDYQEEQLIRKYKNGSFQHDKAARDEYLFFRHNFKFYIGQNEPREGEIRELDYMKRNKIMEEFEKFKKAEQDKKMRPIMEKKKQEDEKKKQEDDKKKKQEDDKKKKQEDEKKKKQEDEKKKNQEADKKKKQEDEKKKQEAAKKKQEAEKNHQEAAKKKQEAEKKKAEAAKKKK